MASADARLRLIVEATTQGGNAFSGLVTQAQTAAREIQGALSGAMAGGAGGGASGGGTMGPIIPSSTLNSLVNMRDQVKMTRGELEKFYTTEATKFGMSVGKDIANPANVATSDLAAFHSEVTGMRTQVEEANPQLDAMGKIFAFSMIKEASAAIKDFGMQLAGVLAEGVNRAASAQSIGVDLKNALTINKDGTILDENGAISVDKLNGVMGNLGKTAQDIGLKTMFSDTDILSVMEHLAANGIDAKTILDGGAKSVAYLAQATKSELQPTVETITAIMHSMGKTLQNDFAGNSNKALMSVADTLVNIKLTTGESLANIGNTMKYVGPIADELKVPFKDLAVSVDILARSGIRGSQAGTALRRMFTNLSPVSAKAAEAMKDLGLITADGTNRFYDQAGKMKSLAEVQSILHDSMKGLSDEQRIYSLRTIFGQYAMQSMAKIASTTPAAFAELADKINQSGTAMRIGEEQMNTFSGQWDVFTENIGIAKKQLGVALLPILTPLVTKLGELFAWFTNLSPEVKKLVAEIAGIVAIGAIVIGTIGGAVASFGLLNAGLALAGTSLGAIAVACASVIAVIAVVAAGAALVYAMWSTNFGGFRDLVDSVWAAIKPTLIDGFNAVKTAIIDAARAVGEWWAKISPSVEAAVANIIAAITFFAPVWKAYWDSTTGVLTAAWGIIVGVIEGAWNVISGIFNVVIHLLSGEWSKLWDDFMQIFGGFVTAFKAIFVGLWNALVAIVKPVFDLLAGLFGTTWDAIYARTSGFFTAIGTAFTQFGQGLFFIVETFWLLISGQWIGAIDNLATVWGLKKGTITDAVDNVLASVTAYFTALPGQALQWGENLISSFIDGITAKWQALKDSVMNIAKTVSDYLGIHSPTRLGPLNDLDQWMPNMFKQFTSDIDAYRPTLQASFSGVAGDISMGVNGGVTMGAPGAGNRSTTIIINYNGTGTRKDDDYIVNQIRRVVAMG